MMKTILITGGSGFIGSHLVKHFVHKYPDYNIVNIDSLTYASNYSYIQELEKENNYNFYKVDINDNKKIIDLFNKYNFDSIINLAAESHVDNSINKPGIFVKTNILGTINLLNIVKEYWNNNSSRKRVFYQISTDEVYGSLGVHGSFTEKSKYSPRSPYSASKASADHFVLAYYNTFNIPTLVSNCSNNFGPNQHYEKLIPTVVKSLDNENKIPVYGDGKNIRDWLYVQDHIDAIDLIFHKGKLGEVYNIGGGNEVSNLDLIKEIVKIYYSPNKITDISKYIRFVDDRKGHDFRYSVDFSKIKRDLGWKPKTDFKDSLLKTIKWYKQK